MFAEWQATPIEEGTSETETVSLPGRPETFAGSEGVTYRSTFEDPRESEDEVAILELRGAFAHCEVEVTGARLDGDWPVEHDAYFQPLRIPFIPADVEENDVVITCHEPRDRYGGIYDTDLLPDDRAVPSIWWDVTLDSSPTPYVESVAVEPQLSGTQGVLDVSTTVVTDEPVETAVTYSVRPEGELSASGMMERSRVEAESAGQVRTDHQVDVREPARWWPREYGKQNRYTLRAKCADTEATVTTGFSDVSFDGDALLVNDVPIPVRGVNVLDGTAEDIERALEVNCNLVRAHAHVMADSVYEYCDQEGLLVWQDLPLTGPGSFNVERGQALADELERALAGHPAVAAYSVHGNPDRGFAAGLGSGFLSKLRLRWRAWRNSYDLGPAERVGEGFSERRPVFPVVGGPGIDTPIRTLFPGWEYGDPEDIRSLLQRYPAAIVAEFGAGSLVGGNDPDADQAGTEPSGDPDSSADTEPSGDDSMEAIVGLEAGLLERQVADPVDSPAYQASVLRTVGEHLRHSGTGGVVYCLRDVDRGGMGVFDEDGTAKPAAEVLATVFEPTQAFLDDPTPGSTAVRVINDRMESMSVTLEWSAGDAGGAMDLELSGQSIVSGDSITIPKTADSVTVTLNTGKDTVVHVYELDGKAD